MPSEPSLDGQHVLVTRPNGQGADRLVMGLEEAGARVTHLPTTRLAPPSDPARLRHAARSLPDYDWVVVTSVNAVERLVAEMMEDGASPSAVRRLAAVGPTTAAAAQTRGFVDPTVPEVYRSEALAARILEVTADAGLLDARILLVQAESARPVLADTLVTAGHTVDVAPAYDVITNPEVADELLDFVELGVADWVTFTASSAIRAYVELVGAQTGGASFAAISPITAAAGSALGLPIHVVADTHTFDGLVHAMADSVQSTLKRSLHA